MTLEPTHTDNKPEHEDYQTWVAFKSLDGIIII